MDPVVGAVAALLPPNIEDVPDEPKALCPNAGLLPNPELPKVLGVDAAAPLKGLWLGAAEPDPNGLQMVCPKNDEAVVAGVCANMFDEEVVAPNNDEEVACPKTLGAGAPKTELVLAGVPPPNMLPPESNADFVGVVCPKMLVCGAVDGEDEPPSICPNKLAVLFKSAPKPVGVLGVVGVPNTPELEVVGVPLNTDPNKPTDVVTGVDANTDDSKILGLAVVVTAAPNMPGLAEVVTAAPNMPGLADVVTAAPNIPGLAELVATEPNIPEPAEVVTAAKSPVPAVVVVGVPKSPDPVGTYISKM